MYPIHYDFIQKRNEKTLQSILTENGVRGLKPRKFSLRVRFMFLLSDILLDLGEWIRPEEIRVFVNGRSVDESQTLANCT